MGASDLYLPYSAGGFTFNIGKGRISVKGLFQRSFMGLRVYDSLSAITGRAEKHAGFVTSSSSCFKSVLEGLHQVDCPQFWGYCKSAWGKA